jgi:hypothetical protein
MIIGDDDEIKRLGGKKSIVNQVLHLHSEVVSGSIVLYIVYFVIEFYPLTNICFLPTT